MLHSNLKLSRRFKGEKFPQFCLFSNTVVTPIQAFSILLVPLRLKPFAQQIRLPDDSSSSLHISFFLSSVLRLSSGIPLHESNLNHARSPVFPGLLQNSVYDSLDKNNKHKAPSFCCNF